MLYRVKTDDGKEGVARSLQTAVELAEDLRGLPPGSACTRQDGPAWLVYASQDLLDLDAGRAPAAWFARVEIDA